MGSVIKFIHTADLHLGKPFPGVGDKGGKLREAQFNALENITATARAEGVDFVVVAGDLFDSNEVSTNLVRRAVNCMKSLAPVPFLILPGTHDLLDEGSVYRRSEFEDAGNIHVFGVHGNSVRIGGAAVHGRANDTKQGGVHPLGELNPDPEAAFNVAVIHAGVEIEGKSNPDDYLVSPEEIASCGMDYVALGHWHGVNDFSTPRVKAWYSGAPEITKFSEADGAGNALLVVLQDEGVSVQARKTGKYRWLERELDVAVHPPGGPLESEIRKLAGDDVLLRVNLKGVLPRGREIDLDALEGELEDDFFHLEIRNAGIGYPLEEVENLFPEGTVGYFYVKRLKELIREAGSGEEQALLEEALYLGSGCIAGELEVG
jgi:DNA repair exonuclease SbcCD nuclease subunit